MRSLLRVALLAGTLVLPSSLRAQAAPEPRNGGVGGMWLSASVAAAGARLTCDICDPTRDAGPALELAAGTYASPSMRVGMDGGLWTFREDDFRETVYTFGVTAEVHPRARSGLHVLGGIGWAGYRAHVIDADPDDEGFRYDSVRLRLGVGWDLPLTASWVVGNRLMLDASSLGTLHDGDAPLDDAVGLSVVRLAVYVRHR